MEQHTSKVETWNLVSESYLDEITDSEEEMGKQLAKIIFRLCPDAESVSALELGAGSGHLSAVLAKCKIRTALLDFSDKALERAKKVYDELGLEGSWICQDLFELDIQETFDIAWNSGVMEHFNDQELDQLIGNFKKLDAKYFILIVPNAESIPYLLYRYHMEAQNAWIWGREFLRTDYVQRFEQAGFKKQDCFYIGSKYTEYTLNEALKRKFPYSEWVECHIAAAYNHSLIGYVFTFGPDNGDVLKTDDDACSIAELKTKVLELRSHLDYASDVAYALNRQKEISEQKMQEMESRFERVSIDLKTLQEELNVKKSELAEKNKLLEELNVCKSELAEKNKLSEELSICKLELAEKNKLSEELRICKLELEEKEKLLHEMAEKKKCPLWFFTR